MDKIAILTGGTSGIGKATLEALTRSGVTVYEFSRRKEGGAHHMSVDISDEVQVKTAVDRVIAEAGRVDILINNAGFGISGAMEFTESAESHRQMEVNVFGMDNMIRAVLPYMRKAGSGRIVNLSSVAGVIPIPFQAWYSATKAAINSLTMALANEVIDYGVSVCSVMPGDIRTGFTAARRKSAVGDDVYGGRISRSVARMEHDEQTGMDPAVAGAFIAKIALKKRVKPHYAIGASYSFFCVLFRMLPCRVSRALLHMIYAK